MPYIIETRTPARDRILGKQWHHVDRTAVATLDEAREAARIALVGRSCRTFAEAARATEVGQEILDLPESGGTIGPFPDGTVIEVRWRSWPDLQADAGHGHRMPLSDANILSLFNTGHYVSADA